MPCSNATKRFLVQIVQLNRNWLVISGSSKVMLLLRPWEWLRSIVMSMSVCVCLSDRISPEPYTRSLPMFVHVAYGRGSVLLRQGDEIQRGRGSFGGFSSPLTMHCTAEILGPTQKRLNWSTCHLAWWVGLARRTVCYVAVTIPKGEGAIWENVPNKPNTVHNCNFSCEGLMSLKFNYLP